MYFDFWPSQRLCFEKKMKIALKAGPSSVFSKTLVHIWDLRNERRHSILTTRHYPHQGSASDWSCRVGNLLQPIRNTTQMWVMKRHLRPCLRRNFVGKSMVAPRIVSCFLRGEMLSCVLRREGESFSG